MSVRAIVSLPFRILRLVTLGSLIVSAWAFAPQVIDAVRIFAIRNDPAALLDRSAASATPDEIRQQAETALAQGDAELAESLSVVARDNGAPFSQQMLAQIAEAKQFSFLRATTEVWRGATTGWADTPTAFAAALAADLTVVGDVRDCTAELLKYPNQDNITVLLASAGIAMTAVTVNSFGAALPVKSGLSLLKSARKLGKFSKPLERNMVGLARRSIDDDVLQAMKRRMGNADMTGLAQDSRRLFRAEAMTEVSDAAGAVYAVSRKQGYRATLQTLENADDVGDLRKLRVASGTLGPRYRASLLLNKGARLSWRISRILAEFLWMILGAVIWVLGAAWTALSLLSSLVRMAIPSFRRVGPT